MAHPEMIAASAEWQPGVRDSSVGRLEKALVVVGLLIVFGTARVVLQTGGGSDDRTDGSALFQLVSGAVYLGCLLTMVYRGMPAWLPRLLVRSWPLVALTLLTLVSTLWSQAPEPTFRRSVALLLTSGFAVYVVVRFDVRTFFNLLVISFAIFVAVSAVAAMVPGLGIQSRGGYSGAWRGLTGNKNDFGRTVALSVALLPTAIVLGLTEWRKTAAALASIGLALLLLSKSATSLVSAFAGVGLGGFVYVLMGGRIAGIRFSPELRLTAAAAAVLAAVLIVTVAWIPMLEALGRDPTLTGRTKLWQWAIAINQPRAWLGSGYRAFWIDENTRYFFVSFAWLKDSEGNLSDSYAGPTHAHSGYVDTLLDLGRVGATLLAAVIISAFAKVRGAVASGRNDIGFIFAVILVFLLLYAISAKSFLQQADDLWFFFVLLYLYSTKETLLSRKLIYS